ncbi:hypothetical protein [Subtercola vilae]|uniref:hypothetical protein n=1 Tax=Subtercola vilae TaxID=2056433 RepID=UPI0010AA620F|nr:hypothetical protein [Subtercola vilae]
MPETGASWYGPRVAAFWSRVLGDRSSTTERRTPSGRNRSGEWLSASAGHAPDNDEVETEHPEGERWFTAILEYPGQQRPFVLHEVQFFGSAPPEEISRLCEVDRITEFFVLIDARAWPTVARYARDFTRPASGHQ